MVRVCVLASLVGLSSAALLKTSSQTQSSLATTLGPAYNFSKEQEKDCKEGKFLPGCDAAKFARYSLLFCATDSAGSIKPLSDPRMLDLKAKRGAAAKESPKEDGMQKWITDFISAEGMSTCPLMATVQAGAPTAPCEYKVEKEGEPKKYNAAAIAGI